MCFRDTYIVLTRKWITNLEIAHDVRGVQGFDVPPVAIPYRYAFVSSHRGNLKRELLTKRIDDGVAVDKKLSPGQSLCKLLQSGGSTHSREDDQIVVTHQR